MFKELSYVRSESQWSKENRRPIETGVPFKPFEGLLKLDFEGNTTERRIHTAQFIWKKDSPYDISIIGPVIPTTKDRYPLGDVNYDVTLNDTGISKIRQAPIRLGLDSRASFYELYNQVRHIMILNIEDQNYFLWMGGKNPSHFGRKKEWDVAHLFQGYHLHDHSLKPYPLNSSDDFAETKQVILPSDPNKLAEIEVTIVNAETLRDQFLDYKDRHPES